MRKILELKNLSKYYGNIKGVKDLSLTLNEGEIFGFIGPNGTGKSTTIRCIMNLINKTSGKILINGKEFFEDDLETKKIIGYLPSEISLYDNFTVKEMLDYHVSFYGKKNCKRRKELIKLFLLEENKKIEDLSLGNLKKLGIVLALIHEPKILILDEPTSGLDPIMQNVFYDLLKKEKEKGTTIFYSTHILSEITKICDRVGIVRNGELIKVEKIDNLIKNSLNYVTIVSSDVSDILNNLKVKVLFKNNDSLKFIYDGDYNFLIKLLAKYNIKKLLIEEAPIEDLVMHYYK